MKHLRFYWILETSTLAAVKPLRAKKKKTGTDRLHVWSFHSLTAYSLESLTHCIRGKSHSPTSEVHSAFCILYRNKIFAKLHQTLGGRERSTVTRMLINAQPRCVSSGFESFVPKHRTALQQRLGEMTNNDINAWGVTRPRSSSTTGTWEQQLDDFSSNENFPVNFFSS